MAAMHVTPEALALAVTSLQRKRANDPWDGPNGTARPNQRPPDGEWKTWMIMAGRGFGKTRSGAEFIRKRVQSGEARRIVLAGPTAADIRDIMIEGESGLQAVCERAGVHMTYNPSKRRITFANGAVAILVSADEPKRFRGLQCDTFWADELASWRYPDAWDQLMLGHRLRVVKNGVKLQPRGIVTTTPRPIPLIKKLIKRTNVVVTSGSTFENEENLAEDFITEVLESYDGTRLGRQELYAEILEDYEGALWNLKLIDDARVRPDAHGNVLVPQLKHVAVAVDPATTHGEKSDQTGIAVAGHGVNDDYYLLHAVGITASPDAWGKAVVMAYIEFEANEIVVEGNQGGEMGVSVIKQAWEKHGKGLMPKIRRVHVKDGKRIRAEPVAMLYEQGRVHHVGTFAAAEDQMVAFPVEEDMGDDIVDAIVHAIVASKAKSLAKVVTRSG